MTTSFERKVWALTSRIPSGKVTSYQEIARALGQTGAARVVGNALNKNPQLIKVPCHRVVRSNGQIGGYAKGSLQKKKLLLREGMKIKGDKIINLKDYFWSFK